MLNKRELWKLSMSVKFAFSRTGSDESKIHVTSDYNLSPLREENSGEFAFST